MLIRNSFEKGGTATNVILEKYAPKNIASITNIHYRPDDPDAYLDVYYTPKNAESAPTILWIHGGGWLAGNKNDLSPWARILAGKGFNVIALNYSLAPEKKYPLPTVQANAALHYFNDHADELRLNPNKLIIGGDSAGAQIAAQITLIETNPEYDPALCHRQLPAQLHHGRQHRPAAPPFQSARHGSQKNRRHH
jgi:acetyl esterase/lipase